MLLVWAFIFFCGTTTANFPSVKWGQSRTQLFLNFGVSCSPGSRVAHVSGDEFRFECGTYQLQLILRGPCTSIECKAGPQGQSELCTLTKQDQRIWDRLTHKEKEIQRFGGKLSIDYRRWEENDDNAEEHSYGSSKLVVSIDSDEAFRNVLNKHQIVVADLSMKWCPLCVGKIKQVLNAARTMKNDAFFVHLDTQEARGARQQYNVTCDIECTVLWVFTKNEEPQKIKQGNEDAEKMIRAYISPAMTHFVDINAYKDFQQQGGHSIVGVFTGDPAFTEFGKIARDMRGGSTRFGFHFGAEGQLAFGIAGAIVPCLISKSPNGTEFLTDVRVSAMTDFIRTRSLPFFPEFDYTIRSRLEQMTFYDGRKVPIAYYWTQAPLVEPQFLRPPTDWNVDEDGDWEPAAHIPADIIDLAQKFRSQLYFTRGESYSMQEFGLQENVFPAFGIASSAEYEPAVRHALPEQGTALTAAKVEQFVEDFFKKKLSPSFKSAPHPTTPWSPGSVGPVVATTVDAVLKGTADVLVYIYQGWKKEEKVAASLSLVAQSLETVPSVKVVSLDSELNYVDPRIFPGLKPGADHHLVLFAQPAEGGPKKPVVYEGRVGQSEVLIWLKEHSSQAANNWSLIKDQAKKMKEDILAARAKLKAEQEAEAQRIAALPRVDLSGGDGGVTKQILQAGQGELPPQGATVHAHYTGTLLSGEKFDSSRDRGSPFQFALGTGGVIKCWDLAFATMQIGERALLTCQSQYAYGEHAMGKIPAGATLQFDVELIAWDPPQTHQEL